MRPKNNRPFQTFFLTANDFICSAIKILIKYFIPILQPSLNCEELDGNLGLELRWTMSQNDIILQLVSNTGNDRYLALGIRDPTESKGIAGDVVVGWISANSGKGGLDDYFLAGKKIPCDDGAESCPDKSKGGTKDIDLLNAVSRSNYTMLTLQRPIKAKGAFDIDVDLVNEQYIFWSVGYKSAAMRKIHKPLKNKEPIAINFGRIPVWNCMTGSGSRQGSSAGGMIKENKPPSKASGSLPTVDKPKRRITSQTILTPPTANNLNHRSQLSPKRLNPTKRPLVRQRPRPTQKQSWSDWFTPPATSSSSPPPKTVDVNAGWDLPNIGCEQTNSDEPLYVHLGPATTSRGNQGIGQHGTAMYINGILAPEMTLQRGKEYTFVVETGLGSDNDQTFHPLYITSDPMGELRKDKMPHCTRNKKFGLIRDGSCSRVLFLNCSDLSNFFPKKHFVFEHNL